MEAVHNNPGCSLDNPTGRCCGVPGVEFAAPVMFWQAKIGRVTLKRVIEAYSVIPAASMNLRIGKGSFVEWDMSAYRIDDESVQVKSQAGWSPYLGMMAVGKVINMRAGGVQVIENGVLKDKVMKVVAGKGDLL